MKINSKLSLSLSLIASLALAACGGGGSSSSGTTGNAAAPATASAPTTTSPTSPTSSTPVVGEALPSLSSPQSGSTAAVGNGVEGIWTARGVVTNNTAFIDTNNQFTYIGGMSTVAVNQTFASLNVATPNWTMTSGSNFSFSFVNPVTAGSGTFAAKQSFSGSFTSNGSNTTLSLTYDPANALAVTQASVAGTWAQTGSSITVANDGTVSGTLSNCTASGTLVLSTPNSNKNLYTMNVTLVPTAASSSGSCSLTSTTTYTGNAAIVFLPTSNANLYTRSVLYVLHSGTTGVAYGQLSKQ